MKISFMPSARLGILDKARYISWAVRGGKMTNKSASKPTDAQLRRLWEWCGVKLAYSNWVAPDGREYASLDDITLDTSNLLKYAVPKSVLLLKGNDHEFFGWKRLLHVWLEYLGIHKDPALALFWAIWEAINDG